MLAVPCQDFQDCLVAYFQGQAVHKDRNDRLSQNTGIQLPTYTQ